MSQIDYTQAPYQGPLVNPNNGMYNPSGDPNPANGNPDNLQSWTDAGGQVHYYRAPAVQGQNFYGLDQQNNSQQGGGGANGGVAAMQGEKGGGGGQSSTQQTNTSGNLNGTLQAALGGSMTPPGSIVSSQSSSPLAGILQSLMQQATTGQTDRQNQYNALIQQIMGKNGYLSQEGTTGMTRIAQNEAQQKGATQQDLISRGLGNSTIVNTMQQGVANNAEQQRQALQENVGMQKAGMASSLFGMNPAPSSSQYMDMISRLAGSGAGVPGGITGNSPITSSR